MQLLSLLLVALLLCSLACAMPAHQGLPLEVAGDWQVRIGPGQVTLAGRAVNLPAAVTVSIEPPAVVSVRDEAAARLPVFNPKAASWQRGLHPAQLRAQECVCTGLLVPGSLKVKAAPGEGEAFIAGTDYGLEEYWTGVGRLEGGKIAADQKVCLDYDYVPCRLDSIVMDATGKVQAIAGKPAASLALPPETPVGTTVLGRVWLQGPTAKLGDLNLYPIDPTVGGPLVGDGSAVKLLPRTLAKLRNGEKVLIIAWGDSVTCGGGVGGNTAQWYQNRFAEELRQRFPKAQIELRTAGWGGRDSRTYMAQPRGAEKDFVRDVLEPKPDLVTIEFVNDAWLKGEAFEAQYTKIMGEITGVGAEVLLISPHLVRPDWLGMADPRFDNDPRPYVADLKRFAATRGIALADASTLWCRLWRQGLPYLSLEANWINHPDARGHQMFADALMAVFPKE